MSRRGIGTGLGRSEIVPRRRRAAGRTRSGPDGRSSRAIGQSIERTVWPLGLDVGLGFLCRCIPGWYERTALG